MTDRQKYVDNMKTKLDKWNHDIDEFEEKAKTASADMKDEYQTQLVSLRKTRDEAVQKLEDVQSATDSAWDDVKKGCDEAWKSISHAMTSAKANFFNR